MAFNDEKKFNPIIKPLILILKTSPKFNVYVKSSAHKKVNRAIPNCINFAL